MDFWAKLLAGIVGAIFALIIVAVVGLIVGLFVMLLWNWLMPVIFGLTTINFIQGWGLTLLIGILFRGVSGNINTKNN